MKINNLTTAKDAALAVRSYLTKEDIHIDDRQTKEIETAISDSFRGIVADLFASAETWRVQCLCEAQNIQSLQHYAQGKEGHVSISSPAIPIRDALIRLHQHRNMLVEECSRLAQVFRKESKAGGVRTNYLVAMGQAAAALERALAAVKQPENETNPASGSK